MPGCRGCCSNALVGISASLYLIIGVGVIAAAGAALFAPGMREIVPFLYSGSMLGGGVAIFVIACIGYFAACDSEQRVCLLWIFTLLTLTMVALTGMGTVVMFEYESVLTFAAATGGDSLTEDVDRATRVAATAVSETSSAALRELASNAFYACNAVVNTTAGPRPFDFDCLNSEFSGLADTINATCMDSTAALNVSAGSVFNDCYAGPTFRTWTPVDAMGRAVALSGAGLAAVLNTPKGLFCACSSTLIETYLFPVLRWAKFVAILVCIFFVLVFLACIHQICQRGCCGGKGRAKEPEMSNIQMTYPSGKDLGKSGKSGKHQRFNDGGYVARP